MNAFTMKEVSKKINVPPGTLRQWEKELAGIIEIPRSKQGARIYSESVIDLLIELKEMYSQKMNKDLIRERLRKKLDLDTEPSEIKEETSLEVVVETVTPIPVDESPIKNADQFFEAMDTYKETFLNEIKNEIRNVVRKEVLEEVKKEIKNGTLTTVKSLSDSIYKSSAGAKEELHELAAALDQTSEQISESLQYLSHSIANVSVETTEEIFSLSKQLSDTTEELSHYVDVTNNEISSLTKAISEERDYFVKERDQYRHEIRQREVAFQDMLSNYRNVAVTKEKKWWKFWG